MAEPRKPDYPLLKGRETLVTQMPAPLNAPFLDGSESITLLKIDLCLIMRFQVRRGDIFNHFSKLIPPPPQRGQECRVIRPMSTTRRPTDVLPSGPRRDALKAASTNS